MSPREVLVTGGTGYVGQFIVQAFADKGWKVTYTYATPRDASALSALHGSPVLVDFASWSPARVAAALSGRFSDSLPACVVNCAAVSSPGDCERDPARADAVNVPRGVLRWLRDGAAARRRGAEASFRSSVPPSLALPVFVHLSTDQVYGGERPWWRESDAPEPRNAYAVSKVRAEALVALAAAGGQAGEALEEEAVDREFGAGIGEETEEAGGAGGVGGETGGVVGEELGEAVREIENAGEFPAGAGEEKGVEGRVDARSSVDQGLTAGGAPVIPATLDESSSPPRARGSAGTATASSTPPSSSPPPPPFRFPNPTPTFRLPCVRAAILRCSIVAGPLPPVPVSRRLPIHALVATLRAAYAAEGAGDEGGRPTVFGDEYRCPVSVHDVARACLSVMHRADELFAQTTDPSDPDLLFATPAAAERLEEDVEEGQEEAREKEREEARKTGGSAAAGGPRPAKAPAPTRPTASSATAATGADAAAAAEEAASAPLPRLNPHAHPPLPPSLHPHPPLPPPHHHDRHPHRSRAPLKSALRRPSSPPFPSPSSPRSLPAPCLVFNVGGPERLSRADMAGIVAAALGLPPLPAEWVVPRASVLGAQGAAKSPADISMRVIKMRDALGIHPVTFGEVVREVIARGEV